MATEETGRLLKLNRLAGNLGEESAKADFDQSPQYNAKPHSLRGRPSLRVKDPALNQDNSAGHPSSPGLPNDWSVQLKSSTDYLAIEAASS